MYVTCASEHFNPHPNVKMCSLFSDYNVHVDFKIVNKIYVTELSNTSSQEYKNLSDEIYILVSNLNVFLPQFLHWRIQDGKRGGGGGGGRA